MAAPLTAGLPLQHRLDDGWTIEFTALDPTTGADVTSVVVSNATMMVELLTGQPSDLAVPPVEPLWVPLPLADQAG